MRDHDAFAALRIPAFRWFILGRFFLTIGIQMQSVIVGWQVYEMTRDPFSLGLIGLAEAIPFLSVALYAGHIADLFDRRRIVLISGSVYFLGAVALLLLSTNLHFLLGTMGTLPIYAVIFMTGLARAFIVPAQTAFMAQIVPREFYANSSTWNSTVWHVAAITGPAIGGLVYGFLGISVAYYTVVAFVLLSLWMFLMTKSIPVPQKKQVEGFMHSLSTGIRFVFRNQVLLGAMTLDMFAVLFGGAVAMLPVFAGEVLKTGPQGLGLLRAAPAAGAVMMALVLAFRPPVKNSGKKLLVGVTGFGICIILFALSRNFVLSLVLLALSGMFDNISVIIRGTILQLFTPDEMRGRVASVNSIFIGSSNEIGSFESGLAARLMGLIPSVVFGGAMTLLVVAVTGKLAPKIRKMQLEAHY